MQDIVVHFRKYLCLVSLSLSDRGTRWVNRNCCRVEGQDFESKEAIHEAELERCNRLINQRL